MDNLRPNHYKFIIGDKEYEVKDLIDESNLSYHIGSAVAYIFRAGKKDKLTFREDIFKAIKHLEFEINKVDKMTSCPVRFATIFFNIEDVGKALGLSFLLRETLINLLNYRLSSKEEYINDIEIAIKLLKCEVTNV
jgi:hypothetical protein